MKKLPHIKLDDYEDERMWVCCYREPRAVKGYGVTPAIAFANWKFFNQLRRQRLETA